MKKTSNKRVVEIQKKRKNLIQWPEEEIRKKGNCISQYKTLPEREHIIVINNPRKSKRAYIELRRCCVCVIWCVLVWALNRYTVWNFCQSSCELFSLCMRQYESYCSINTRYVTVFPFNPHDIQLPSTNLNNLNSTAYCYCCST
jgi:hypothetical protein